MGMLDMLDSPLVSIGPIGEPISPTIFHLVLIDSGRGGIVSSRTFSGMERPDPLSGRGRGRTCQPVRTGDGITELSD